jgi:hypothetical protein
VKKYEALETKGTYEDYLSEQGKACHVRLGRARSWPTSLLLAS